MHIGFEVVEEHSTLEAHSSEGEDSKEKGVGEGVVGEGEGERKGRGRGKERWGSGGGGEEAEEGCKRAKKDAGGPWRRVGVVVRGK